MILISDFNCDYLNTSYHQMQRLNEFLNINHLKQLILTATRITQTSSSLIDLIITTTSNLFNKSGTLSNSFSDHFPTATNGVIKGKTNEQKHKLITTRKYDQDRVEAFKKDLSSKTATSCSQSTNDIHQRWKSTIAAINELVENRFPKSTKRIRRKTLHPWICTDLLRLMRKRDRVHKHAIDSGNDHDQL